MSRVNPSAFKNASLGCSQLFIVGWLYSYGVFIPYIHEKSKADIDLRGAWSSGLGLISLMLIPAMSLTGIYLCKEQIVEESSILRSTKKKLCKVRFLVRISSFCYGMFGLAGFAVLFQNPKFIYMADVFIATAIGISKLKYIY